MFPSPLPPLYAQLFNFFLSFFFSLLTFFIVAKENTMNLEK